MSRRQRSAREKAQRSRVALEKTLRRRARTRRAATAAAAAVTLAGTGGAATAAPTTPASPASPASASLLDCAGATTPDSDPSNLTEVGGKLFFTASDARGSALWRSNGTAGGTVLLKRLGSDDDYYDYGYANLAGVGGTLFFTVDGDDDVDELWKSDGTKAGTVLVKRFASDDGEYGSGGPDNLTAAGDTLFFTASDPVHGEELWRSNGTRAGTVMVKNIQTGDSGGEYSYGPSNLTAVGDTLFFTADDGIRGQELWRSDGTKDGTVLVRNIRAGSYSSYASRLTAVGDKLFFRARDGIHGRELWVSDGTKDGTVLVEDIRPGAASTHPNGLVAAGDRLFFSAEDDTPGRDLWVSDGTEAGTALVKDFVSSGDDDYDDYSLGEIAASGDNVFFAADDGTHGLELWRSDGTEAGTVIIKDIRAGDYPSYPGSMVDVDGTLFFTARDGVHGRELWSSDGTKTGTTLVEDIHPTSSSNPRELIELGGELMFEADDRLHGEELWRSDGTEAGTDLVVDINKGGAFDVSSRADANAETGTMRVWARFDGAGTLTVAPAREGGIRALEREITGEDSIRLTLKLTRAATRTLRRTGRVEVGAKFTFASCGGAVRSQTHSYLLKK
jgi:ELWxxDGT repeat protein